MREEERQYFFRSKEKKESEQSKTAKFLWKLALPAHVTIFYLVVSLVNEWSYTREKEMKWIEESL